MSIAVVEEAGGEASSCFIEASRSVVSSPEVAVCCVPVACVVDADGGGCDVAAPS